MIVKRPFTYIFISSYTKINCDSSSPEKTFEINTHMSHLLRKYNYNKFTHTYHGKNTIKIFLLFKRHKNMSLLIFMNYDNFMV